MGYNRLFLVTAGYDRLQQGTVGYSLLQLVTTLPIVENYVYLTITSVINSVLLFCIMIFLISMNQMENICVHGNHNDYATIYIL